MSGEPQEPGGVFSALIGAEEPASEAREPEENLIGILGVDADSPTDSIGSSRLHSGMQVLLLVVVVATGVLFIMRQFGLGARLRLIEIAIDYPIDDASPVNIHEQEQVLMQLRASAVAMQVPLKDVKKNPFHLGLRKVDATPIVKPVKTMDRAEYERRQRKQLIRSTFAGLKLNTVIAGSAPVARISGQNVRIGDTVAKLFVVRAIHGRSVDLLVDGDVYTLTMGK